MHITGQLRIHNASIREALLEFIEIAGKQRIACRSKVLSGSMAGERSTFLSRLNTARERIQRGESCIDYLVIGNRTHIESGAAVSFAEEVSACNNARAGRRVLERYLEENADYFSGAVATAQAPKQFVDAVTRSGRPIMFRPLGESAEVPVEDILGSVLLMFLFA